MILAALRSNARSALSTSLPDALTAAVKQLSMPALVADLLDRIRLFTMAKAIITFKLMPESPDVDRKPIAETALKIAKENGAIGQMQTKEDPIGYGLVAILILAMYDVNSSDFEAIAAKMGQINGVESSEVANMDLALG